MKQKKESDIAKFFCILGGVNVVTPPNVADLKIAELNWNPNLEQKYSYIQKAMNNLADNDVKTILKRIYIDYVKPTVGIDLVDFFQKLSIESADYLATHKEERTSIEESKSFLEAFLKGEDKGEDTEE